MKRLALLFVVVSLAAASTLVAQPTRFQQVIEIQVAPVHQAGFENMAMKIKEASDKTESNMTWTMFQVAMGKPSPTYRVVLGFNKWAERDQWGTVPGVLAGIGSSPPRWASGHRQRDITCLGVSRGRLFKSSHR